MLLVGAEAVVIVDELGFTAPQYISFYMEHNNTCPHCNSWDSSSIGYVS